MAERKDIAVLPNGQRIAWTGWDWVPVSNEFDPRQSSIRGGLARTGEALLYGGQQAIAALTGDDEALEDIAQKEQLSRNEARIMDQYGGPGFMAGRIAPYVAAPLAAGAAAPAGMGAAAAIAADVGLGGLEYGTPGERAVGAAMGAAGPAAAVAARPALRALGLGRGAAAARVRQGVEGRLTSPMAGGEATSSLTPGDVPMAARLAGRILGLGSASADQTRLAQTARARGLAEQYGIRLSPAMRTGSMALEQAEQSMMSQPWSRAPGARIVNEYQEGLEERLKRFLLPQYEGPLDQDFLAALDDDLIQGYQEIAKASKGIQLEAGDITARAEDLLQGQNASWTRQDFKHFQKLLEQIDNEAILDGEAAWNMQRQFAERAARDFKKQYEKGQASQAVADALEFALIDQSDALQAPAINLLRKRYRVRQALESANAIDRGGFYLGRGNNAIRRAFPLEYGRGRRFPNNPELGALDEFLDYLEVGNTLFRTQIGDSGTATRLSMADVSMESMAGNARRALAASLYYGEPTLLSRPAAMGAAVGALGAGGASGLSQ